VDARNWKNSCGRMSFGVGGPVVDMSTFCAVSSDICQAPSHCFGLSDTSVELHTKGVYIIDGEVSGIVMLTNSG